MISYANGLLVDSDHFSLPVSQTMTGSLRGFEIFTVFKAIRGVPFLVDEHIARLDSCARHIHMSYDLSTQEIKDIVHMLIQKNKDTNGILLTVLLSGGRADYSGVAPIGDAQLSIWTRPLNPIDATKGRSLATFVHQRPFPEVKLTFYMGGILAHQTVVKEFGAEYPVFVSPQTQDILEGSTFSIACIKDGVLKTPPLDGRILESITRRNVLKLAKKLGIEVQEKAVSVDDFLASDEIMMMATTLNVLGVVRVNDRTIGNGDIGPITKQVQSEWDLFEQNYINLHLEEKK